MAVFIIQMNAAHAMQGKASNHQDLDVVASLWGRNEGFSPAATRLPRHCTGPFFLDPKPAIILVNWGTVMAVFINQMNAAHAMQGKAWTSGNRCWPR